MTTPNRATSGVILGTVTGAAIAAAGSGGTNGTAVVTGTTGTGTPFQADVTIAGGEISAINSIAVGGAYSKSPTNPAAEPVTGGGLVGATLNLTISALATPVAPANGSRRQYMFQPSTVTTTDWAVNDSGNGVAAALGAAGSWQVARMQSTTAGGQVFQSPSTAAVFAYNATPFAGFTANES